jgi:hypothetical protein
MYDLTFILEEIIMKTLFILMMLVGCGSVSEESVIVDYSSSPAVCVDDVVITYEEGMDINVVVMNEVFNIVEKEMNNVIPAASLDMDVLFASHQLTAHYVTGLSNRGEYHASTTEILINYPSDTSDVLGACVEKYYMLSHELLHYVAQYQLGVNGFNNSKHHVDNMFTHDDVTSVDNVKSIEEYVHFDIVSMCIVNS